MIHMAVVALPRGRKDQEDPFHYVHTRAWTTWVKGEDAFPVVDAVRYHPGRAHTDSPGDRPPSGKKHMTDQLRPNPQALILVSARHKMVATNSRSQTNQVSRLKSSRLCRTLDTLHLWRQDNTPVRLRYSLARKVELPPDQTSVLQLQDPDLDYHLGRVLPVTPLGNHFIKIPCHHNRQTRHSTNLQPCPGSLRSKRHR